jgi:hypothetical protein
MEKGLRSLGGEALKGGGHVPELRHRQEMFAKASTPGIGEDRNGVAAPAPLFRD